MPYLNLKLCTSRPQNESIQFAGILTDLTAEVLKKKRELTVVCIEHIAPELWFVGGIEIGHQLGGFYLDIKITEGTNTKDEKAAYVSRVFAAIENLMGPIAEASYIVIHEVHADSWGYQGQTQESRYIKGKSL